MPASLRPRLRDPVLWTNALQIVKTVLAAVIAWLLAVHVFDIAQAFLAPWAALLTVHATVFRTLKRGVQQVGASVSAWSCSRACWRVGARAARRDGDRGGNRARRAHRRLQR